MKVKLLFEGNFQVVACMAGDECPTEDFLAHGPADTAAARNGLAVMLQHLANRGFQDVPAKWFHEASKAQQVHEFIKGPLRLFFFKGSGVQIAVCTGGARKQGNKADAGAVAAAARWRAEYFEAVANNTLEITSDEDDE